MRGRSRRWRWTTPVSLVAVAAVSVLAISPGSAATTTKPYTAFFDQGPVPGGSAVTVDLVVTNLAGQQSLGSANVTAQAGFTITGASVQGGAGDVGGTSFPTTLLELRDLGIAPSTSRTIELSVTTPCSTSSGDAWGIRAKQSNDFSGPPGNDFSFRSDGSNLVTSVGGAGTPASLAFTVQPGNAVKAPSVLSAVKVTARDACGSLVTQATGSVSISLVKPSDTAFGGGTATLGGTPSQPIDAAGVATFADLTVSESGLGYKLKASFPGVLDALSNEFDVYDGLCPPSCTASNGAGTQIAVEGAGNGTALGVGPATNTLVPGSQCGTGLQPLGATFVIVPPAGDSTTFKAILTIEKRGLQGVGVANIVVCASSGPDEPLARLPLCAKKNPNPKCIVSQTASNAGDAVITMLFDGDPIGSGFG